MSQSVNNEEPITTPSDGINSDRVNINRVNSNGVGNAKADHDRISNDRTDNNRIESNSGFGPAPESSEMLRWRADTLMDEMMFSGIDLNGAGNRVDDTQPVSMPSANGSHAPSPQTPPDEIPVATPMQSNPWLFSAAERYRQNGYISSPPPPNPLATPNGAHRNVQPATNGNDTRPISSNGYGPTYVPNGTAPNGTVPNGAVSNGTVPNGAVSNGTVPNGVILNGTESSPIMPNGSTPNGALPNGATPERPPDGMFQPMPGLGPVTRQPVVEEPASAMRVGEAATQNSPDSNLSGRDLSGKDLNSRDLNSRSSNTRNSNLLPRMSVLNVQSLQKEVLALEEEIDLILPSSHPSNDRAHHLLHKAYTILQNDIERSAEVEYYMQQVRSIIQRTRQMHRSSRAYRQNLTLYLSAWFCLSLIILTAGYIYRFDIELWAVETIRLSVDHPIFKHLIAFSTTLFAGSLGSAMGALYNMLNYGRQSYGLFDRKYGLRGLILPLIGILFGMFIYLLWGLAGNFLEIDASLNLFAGTLLALIAFVFGMSQETIYGTRS